MYSLTNLSIPDALFIIFVQLHLFDTLEVDTVL